MSYPILYRPAEAGPETPWTPVSSPRTLAGLRDELAGWQGPALFHGDLVRVADPTRTAIGSDRALYVFDGDSGALVTANGAYIGKYRFPWLAIWDSGGSLAVDMVKCAPRVKLQKLVLVATSCAREILKFATNGEDRPEIALDLAEAWARGSGSAKDAADYGRESSLTAATGNSVRNAYVRWACLYAAEAAEDGMLSVLESIRCSERVAEEAGKEIDFESIVRRIIPVSVAICAQKKLRDPLPIPRENPARGLVEVRIGRGARAQGAASSPARSENVRQRTAKEIAAIITSSLPAGSRVWTTARILGRGRAAIAALPGRTVDAIGRNDREALLGLAKELGVGVEE